MLLTRVFLTTVDEVVTRGPDRLPSDPDWPDRLPSDPDWPDR